MWSEVQSPLAGGPKMYAGRRSFRILASASFTRDAWSEIRYGASRNSIVAPNAAATSRAAVCWIDDTATMWMSSSAWVMSVPPTP